MKKLFALMIIVCLTLPAVSQISPYLEKGKSGFGLNAGYEQANGFSGMLGNLGFSYKGIFDIEANVFSDGYYKDAEGILRDDATSLGFMGCINWWLLRKQPTPMAEVLVGLTAGVEHFAYNKYTYLDPGTGENTDYHGSTDGLFGFDSRVKFRLDDSWSLMPGFAVVYSLGTETYSDVNGDYSSMYNGFMSRQGVSVSKRLDKGNIVYFEANHYTSTFDSHDYYEAKIGFVFSQK
ncbi:MAG: hypothetical protein WC699_04890 [Bacteroidales bacterium]|jgi:hypothetical protein